MERLSNVLAFLLIDDRLSRNRYGYILSHGMHKCGDEWSVIRCGEGAQHTIPTFFQTSLTHKTHVATCVIVASLRGWCARYELERCGWQPQPNDSRHKVRAEKLSVSKFPATRDPGQIRQSRPPHTAVSQASKEA
jgi:hypothetical protein